MKKYRILILAILLTFSGMVAAEEGLQVDFILLIDTSLSMAPAIDELKQFVASGIVGRFVQQDDWVAVLSFYGESTLIWEGDIHTEADKAALVRSLHALKATGRFTDIGAALDEMKQLVLRRNRPEIPKYILLLTDEIQEAPPGSEYHSDEFTVSHELLEYVRRVDLGTFQAITIGYGLASRIESDLQALMKTLKDPPDRPQRFLPGDDSVRSQAASSLEATASTSNSLGAGSSEGETASGYQESIEPAVVGTNDSRTSGSETTGSAPAGEQTGTAPRTEPPTGERLQPGIYLILALVIGAAILSAILLISRKPKKKKKNLGQSPEDTENKDPSVLKDGKK